MNTWLTLLLMALAFSEPARAAPAPSIAFYYGADPPTELLGQFQQVVVDPDHVDAAALAALRAGGAEVLAYVSLGEADPARPFYKDLQRAWLLGRNAGWRTDVIDQRQEGWRRFLLERVLAPLWQRGYRAFFLDTLDSHQLAAPAIRGAQRQALVETLRALRQRYPEARLLFNRGFELLPEVAGLCAGVVAESLLRGFEPRARRYPPVAEADQQWLLARLREVRERYRLPVYVIDYAPPGERAAAREQARRIAALGFVPWVTSGELDLMGVGSIEPWPQRVLALFDGAEPGVRGPADTRVRRYAAMPLQHLGLQVEYRDLRGALPQAPLTGRYAGVVLWSFHGSLPEAARRFLRAQREAGVPLALLGALPEPDLAWLGAARGGGAPQEPLRLAHRSALVGFEAPVVPRLLSFAPLRGAGAVQRHLTVEDQAGQGMDAVLTAPWGGWALDPYVLEEGPGGAARWILDPFAFFEAALALPPRPIPDVTTLRGRRLLTLHLGAAGFGSRAEEPGTPWAARRVLDDVLLRYRLPTSVEVPGADELRGEGLAGLSRRILQLPFVRRDAEGGAAREPAAPLVSLPLSLTQVGPPTALDPPRPAPALPDDRRFTRHFSAAGPLYGFRALIDLLRLTERPRRLTPAALTVHYAAAQRPAGLRALRQVLDYALRQPVQPVPLEDYLRRVGGLQELRLARQLDGAWRVRGAARLGCLRLDPRLGALDRARSRGVQGLYRGATGRYLELAPRGEALLVFGPEGDP